MTAAKLLASDASIATAERTGIVTGGGAMGMAGWTTGGGMTGAAGVVVARKGDDAGPELAGGLTDGVLAGAGTELAIASDVLGAPPAAGGWLVDGVGVAEG